MVGVCKCSGGSRQFSVPCICPADDAGGSGWMCTDLRHVVGVLERPSGQVKLACMGLGWLFVALSGVNVRCECPV